MPLPPWHWEARARVQSAMRPGDDGVMDAGGDQCLGNLDVRLPLMVDRRRRQQMHVA